MRTLIILLIVSFWATTATAELLYSPVIHHECRARDLLRDFARADAEAWELLTIRALIRDGASTRHQLIIAPTDCGAFGVFQMQPQQHPLNITYDSDCAYQDPVWRDNILALLYSDYGARVQLEEWRGIVDVVVQPAQNAGYSDAQLAAIAALANSTPRGTLSLARAHNWRLHAILDGYLAARPYSDHRRRRVAWIHRHLIPSPKPKDHP